VVTTWTDEHFIAGDLALDFANTVYRRTPELGHDLFDGTQALTGWLERAGLLHDPARDAALEQARALRRLLWAVFDAQAQGRPLPADALTELLDTVARGLGTDLSVAADGTAVPRTTNGAVAAVAVRGLALALRPPERPVRACDRCGWFFLDTSRGRRRRWCSMKTCGNQAKAARFRSAHP
jgi:predicted RNA-binding Zn ribbon-like protein